MKQRFFFSILCGVLGSLGTPCHAGPPFNVDDPATSERHKTNLFVAYLSQQNASGEQQALPSFSLAYGYSNRLEFDLGFGVASLRATGSPRIAGFGDMTTGVRWRFLEETRRRPQLAFGYQIKIPTADVNRGLSSGTVDNAAWLSEAKTFGRWVSFANVGYNFLGGHSGTNNLFWGTGLTYQLTEKLVVGGQVYGSSANAPGARSELAWGLGLTYNFAPDRSLLVSAGRSEHGFSDLNLYVGVAFTLGK